MQKIIPSLWFDNQAEEAAQFYTSIFDNSQIGNVTRYDEASAKVSGQPEGSVLTVEFTVEGFQFIGLNGGPNFKINPSISFFVRCKTDDEVQQLWDKLSTGGTPRMPLSTYPFSDKYGWIEDRYGVSWQLMKVDEVKTKIIPSLMFVGLQAGKAEEAINFYTQVFKNAKVGDIARYSHGMAPDKEGTVMYAEFELEGQLFAAMDSAQEHHFNFNEAVSLMVNCESQKEIDHYWENLSAHPEAEQCGWLKDSYGVSWQIVPMILDKLINDPDAEKAGRTMQAMLQMKKLDIEELKKAYAND